MPTENRSGRQSARGVWILLGGERRAELSRPAIKLRCTLARGDSSYVSGCERSRLSSPAILFPTYAVVHRPETVAQLG